MGNSILYDLIEAKLYSYREKLEKENDDYLSKCVLNLRNDLKKSLNEEQLKLVENYKQYFSLRAESIEIQTGIKLLNYGVQIGMQLQKAFDEEQ